MLLEPLSTPRQMSLNELKIGIRTLHIIGKHVAKSGFEHLFHLADGGGPRGPGASGHRIGAEGVLGGTLCDIQTDSQGSR